MFFYNSSLELLSCYLFHTIKILAGGVIYIFDRCTNYEE